MTKSKSTRLTALLMSLVLITSCFVGGTLARYITSTSSEDSARVAVWGINADEIEMDLFDAQYELDGTIVAKANDGDNIIAPGTGKMSKFSIVNLDDTLAPEVMYEVRIDLDDSEIDQRILDNPSIQWKLDNNAWGTWESTKADILALSGDASGVKTYAPNTIAEEFANGKEHTISWQWLLDNNNDIMDTAMGNLAVEGDITAKIVVKITAEQTIGSTISCAFSNNKFNPNTITENYYINASGIGKPVEGYNMTDYIYVAGHNLFMLGGDGYQYQSQRNIGAYVLYDENKNFIQRITETYGTGFVIPNGTYYIRLQYHNTGKLIMEDGLYHDMNQINLDVWSSYDSCDNNNTTEKYDLGTLVSYGDSHVGRGLWQPAVIEYFDVENHVNLGLGSSTVALNDSATQLAFVTEERIQAIKDANPDTIIIIGGTNDVHLDTPLGTTTELTKNIMEKDLNNFYGAYSYLLETLLNWKPTLNIFVSTIPHGTYDTYHDVKYSDISTAIKNIAQHYSLPVVDIYNDCGINSENLSEYSEDGIHYNELGNEKVSDLMISVIKEYLYR